MAICGPELGTKEEFLAQRAISKLTAARDQKRHELDLAETALDEAYAQLKKAHGVG